MSYNKKIPIIFPLLAAALALAAAPDVRAQETRTLIQQSDDLYAQRGDLDMAKLGLAKLQEALIGTGFPYRSFDHIDAYLAIFKELTQNCAGIRRPGAAALDLAWVACGRLDGFWEFGLSPWDMAAGTLLITEAGGLATDLAGEPDYLESGNVVAGSPKVFAQLLQTVQSNRGSNLPR